MGFCKHRVMDKCKKDGRPCIFSEECFEPEDKKPQTNADSIRSMSDEELAEFLEGEYGNFMAGTALKWLQKQAKERE